MEIWLDTCDSQIVSTACRLGIIHGITTNPSILASAQEDQDKVISRLLDIQKGPVAVQVVADDADEMIKQALALHDFSHRIIVKIPVVQEGLAAMKVLVQEGISIMATAVFQPNQALLAGIVGADYVAPYVSRMFDEGIDAYSALETMASIYKNPQFKTKILAAALRTTEQITTCASMGISAVTLKGQLFSQFIANDKATVNSLMAFAEDWEACKYQILPALVLHSPLIQKL